MRLNAHQGRRATAAVLFVAGMIGVGAARASAENQHESFPVAFTSTGSDNPATFAHVDFSRCGPPAGVPSSPCVTPVSYDAGHDSSFTGSLQGTSTTAQSFSLAVTIPTPTGPSIPLITMVKVVAAITGCGTGSVILQFDNILGAPGGTWKFVTGSGTDGLQGVSGHGVSAGDPTDPLTAHFTGRVSCHAGHDG